MEGVGKSTLLRCMLHTMFGKAVSKVKIEMKQIQKENKALDVTIVSSNFHIDCNFLLLRVLSTERKKEKVLMKRQGWQELRDCQQDADPLMEEHLNQRRHNVVLFPKPPPRDSLLPA